MATAWFALGCIFIYLAFDEFLGLHEILLRVRLLPELGGFLHFRWVIAGLGFVLVVAVAFLPFLLRLPRITATRLVIAGAVYVAGAAGMEMVNGYILETFGQRSIAYSVSTMIEESVELIGLVLALRTLILHPYEVLPARAAATT